MATEKRTTVKQIVNNIVYVEPNYIHSTNEYDVNGLNTYEFTPPLEDYSVFVNLEVEIRGRNIQSSKTANNKKLIMSYVSKTDGSSSVNFMQGSKIPIGDGNTTINSLTTNYTDLFLGDLKKNGPSTEMFGIKSIDISYNNYMVPEVTIEFVDVRGVALFAQKEYYETNKNIDKAIDSNNQEDIANTFFQCFFTFPYPKFTILVKGFYGQPVSYELTCADFRARFDSKTGNFACTAKFVGYYFSFLNDVMINGLVAAPYSDYIGAAYWAERSFKLKGLSGNDFPIPKFGELLRNMKDIESTADKVAQSDPIAQEMVSHENQKSCFTSIKSAYSEFVTKINELVKDREINGISTYFTSNNEQGEMKGMIYLCGSTEKWFSTLLNDGNGNIKRVYDGLVKQINEYNEKFPSQKLPIPNSIHDKLPKQLIATQSNNEIKAYVIGDAIPDINKKGNENHNMFNRLVVSVENENNKGNKNQYLDFKYAYYYSDNGFSYQLEKYIEEIDKNIKDANDKLESLKDDAISKALGFRPTVENMTKIVMAHFETFARMIFETAKSISNQKPSRTIESLGVGDIHNVSDVTSVSKNNDTIVPPFPKVTREVRRGDVINREESWVGDYSGDFREKDLVHGLINGVNEIAKDIIQYENSSTSDSNVTSNGPGYGGGSNTSTKATMRYPLSPLDMIATEKIYDNGGYDQNEPSSFLSLVALRAIQILGINHFKEWGKKVKALGIAEAKNFLAEHKLNKEMLKKLAVVNSDYIVEMLNGKSTDVISKPGNGSKPWPWRINTNGAGMLSTDGDLNICNVQYNAFSVPYQNLSWDKINNETINSQNGLKAMWSNDYLNTKAYANCTKDNIFTFDTNINKFKVIAESQLQDSSNSDLGYYQNLFTKECSYDITAYDKLTDKAEYVISYIIENAASMVPSDKSCMLPTSKAFYANKTFGGGYNMNYFADFNPGEGGENWTDKDGKEVKRKGDDGYQNYLKEFNSRDFTFTEFPGLLPSLEPYTRTEALFKNRPRTSVFGQALYYWQKDVRAKALMFLASLGYAFDYKKIIEDYICDEDKTMFVIPLPAVMFIGGLLWANTTEGRGQLNNGLNIRHYSDSLQLLLNLRDDVQRRFIKIFEKWVSTGVEGNNLLRSFNEIKSGMEIEFLKRSPEEFFRIMPEVEDNHALGWSTNFSNFNSGYKSVSDVLVNEFGDSFFRNYITIDEDIYGNNILGTRGMRLGNRDGGPSAVHACNFALAGCVFSKNSKYFMKGKGTNVKIDVGELKGFFDGFLSIIKEEKYDENVDNTSISQASDPQDSTKDIKIGIYRYCKMIYDKWIAGISEEDFESKWTMTKFFDSNDKYFYFIDAFYNTKSDIKMNIGDFCDQIVSCYRNDQYSLLSFLSSVYAKNKLNFICVQNFLDLGDKKNMENMFDAIPYTSYWDIKRNPNFIVMYPYETSNYLEVENSEYENDGFMINMPPSTKNKWPEPLVSRNSGSNIGFNIPAFGVSYGKMYQSYFKDIDISMDSPTVTEQSIKAQFAIACQNNVGEQTGDRSQIYTYGQDLYSIYSNNSYTCNITMMGCAWIQPLMYFVLNNIPMFRGTYLIEKVWHHIEPGDMTTKFMGVRMSNVCTRIAEQDSARSKNNQDGSGSENGDYISIEEKLAGIDNDCPYKAYPLEDVSSEVELKGDEKEKANTLINKLISFGYTTTAAAGIVGNIWEESNFNDKALIIDSNRYKSGGLCMWNATNLCDLVNGNPYGTATDKSCSRNITESQLPNADKQLNFLHNSIIKSYSKIPNYNVKLNYSYWKQFPGKNLKSLLNSASSPAEAAKIFAAVYERCGKCMQGLSDNDVRINKAKAYFASHTSNTKIAKNTDNHISKLAVGFLNALNKTAAASSENVVIGIDSSRSKDNSILLTNGQNSNNFSTVLDMILSAYSDKVESVYWVLPGNGDNINSMPKYYLVNVKEGSKVTKVYVSNENSLNKAYSKASVTISDGKATGIHEDFCKALVKKYGANTEQLRSDTVFALTNYDVLFKNDLYKLKDCGSLMKEVGVNEGVGGQLQASMKIGNWDAGAAANFLINHGLSASKHICAFAVQQAVIAGGIECPSGNGYKKALNMVSNGGWRLIKELKSTQLNSWYSNENNKPNVGDVIGMTRGSDTNYVGHVCMYCGDGNGWYSDFKQKNGPYVYNKYGEGTCWIIRYDGKGKTTNQKPITCYNGKCLR